MKKLHIKRAKLPTNADGTTDIKFQCTACGQVKMISRFHAQRAQIPRCGNCGSSIVETTPISTVVETGIKPWVCDCGKSFRTEIGLTLHREDNKH